MSIGDISAKTFQSNAGVTNYINNINSAFLSPRLARGVYGWEFDIPQDERVRLESDITDHYTENNSFVNDHIVRKPIVITLTGLKGEKVFSAPSSLPGGAQELLNGLTIVTGYLGDFTDQYSQEANDFANRARQVESEINEVLNRVQNIVGLVSSPFTQNETLQQKAYSELYGLWVGQGSDLGNGDLLLTVQTPWQYYENMAIKSIDFVQTEETDMESQITITLKEMRFSEIETTTFDEDLFPPREEMQSVEQTDQGLIRGEESNESLLFSLSEEL